MKTVRAPSLVAALATLSIFGSFGCSKEEKKAQPSIDEAKSPPEPSAISGKVATAAKKLDNKQKHVDSLTHATMKEVLIPAENPQSDEKVALGHRLFFEKRLSVDGSVSCYSCHQNENGNGGATPTAIGAKEKKLSRHSPVIWNVGYLPALYWDGRSSSLEAQAKGAWGGGNMGVGKENLDKKAAEIAALPEYKDAFEKVFPGKAASADLVAQAISSYERTLICNDTAYDKYAAGDKAALTDEQKDGLEVFMGKAMCTACHAPPLFSSAYVGKGSFFNVGIGTQDVDEAQVDVGRMKVSKDDKDWAAFKPPSLRNVTKSAPYFHDGSTSSLTDAVKLMASGGHKNKNKSALLSDKKLSDEEISQIVAFLGALQCGGTLEAPSAQKVAPKK